MHTLWPKHSKMAGDLNRYICDLVHTVSVPPHPSLARADQVYWSKIWSWGQPLALIQALQSSNLHLGLRNKKKAIPLYFLGHRSSERHWPKQQWQAPCFFSAISKCVPSAVHNVLLLSLLGRFHIPACSTCFSIQNAKCSWLLTVIDWKRRHVYYAHAKTCCKANQHPSHKRLVDY